MKYSALLAARHAQDRARTPALPERYEQAAACAELLAPLLESLQKKKHGEDEGSRSLLVKP